MVRSYHGSSGKKSERIGLKLNVFTDVQLFERNWRKALNANTAEEKAELLKTLHQDRDYHCVHRYAAKALAIVLHSADIYYWLIHAIHKQGHSEIARSELQTAKKRLLEEKYAVLANRLAVKAGMI